jgi:SanA protein
MAVVRAYYRWVLIVLLVVAVVCLLIPFGMRATVSPFIYESLEDVPRAEVAIVLGASVMKGKPSPILADRANAAIALYSAGKVGKILVTGDNGVLSYDEVTPVRKYLLDAGVLPSDIFLDHAGFDTYSSMYRARNVFLAQSATIVTQDFHLPRALWIARHLGLAAYGVTAEGGNDTLYNYMREIPASLKALVDIVIHREPKYLGSAIPLSESGEATWY